MTILYCQLIVSKESLENRRLFFVEKWDKKKQNQELMEQIYFELSQTEKSNQAYFLKRSVRMHNCGTYLKFSECPNGCPESRHLINASFCTQRMCTLCQWRKSLFIYHQFLTVAHEVANICPGTKYVFITLTGRNVSAEKLSNEITHYLKSLRRLIRYKAFKAIKGTFRTLEISYNPVEDTYHPHFHIIGAVQKSYFTKPNLYISQKKLTNLWKKAFQVDYNPIVHIEKVRKKKKDHESAIQKFKKLDNNLAGAAAEVAKYSVKFSDIFNSENKNEVVRVLDHALNCRRLVGYTGIMKTAYQNLKLNDVEDSDLVDVDGTKLDENCRCEICKSELNDVVRLYNFNKHQYKEYIKKGDE